MESALPQDEEKDEDDNGGKRNVRERSSILEEPAEVEDDPDNSVAEESEDNWDVGLISFLKYIQLERLRIMDPY